MISRTSRIGALAVAAALALAACGGSATQAPATQAASTQAASSQAAGASAGMADCATGSITASGSTALQPLVDAAGKQYATTCTGATINVQGGGSGTGLTQVSQGAVDIGDSDVTAESKLDATTAATLVDHVVARQSWVMVANTSVTGITNLTTDQAKQIWTGAITNWKQLGGPDQPIVLIIRPASSGTRATFKKIVLGGADEATTGAQTLTEDSNGAVAAAVQATPGSTSVLAFTYFEANQSSLVGFQLDGVTDSIATMKDGSYKLQGFGHMYTKGDASGLAKAFLDYIVTSDVQNTLLPSLYYAPAGQ